MIIYISYIPSRLINENPNIVQSSNFKNEQHGLIL